MIRSIHRQLLAWVLGALGIGASLLIAASYQVLFDEMNEVFEDNLKQVALAVVYHQGSIGTQPRLAQRLPPIYEEYGAFEFVTALWTREGRRLQTSDETVTLPFLSRSGLSLVTTGGEDWYLYTVVLEDRIVQAAQRARERRALAVDTASKLILPALLLTAVIAALLVLALRRGLAPLSQAATDVAARSVDSLESIPLSGQPLELHLLIGAINGLMQRLGSALALQREFLADAAHELRTPITALKLQLQLLERASDVPQRDAALAELRAGIERTKHLVEQLLQLSRLAPETPALRREPVDLAALSRAAVSHFSARADASSVDLGASAEGPVPIAGDALQLAILLNNLIDNAIRHTPAGGRVDVTAGLFNGHPGVKVTDTGPGIAAAERHRVFDRFYRAAAAGSGDDDAHGSGLGLAIVKAVAERHAAQLSLDDAEGGGLCVTVLFPTP